jgi:hypothetical protein
MTEHALSGNMQPTLPRLASVVDQPDSMFEGLLAIIALYLQHFFIKK